jgi:hypothetical protein
VSYYRWGASVASIRLQLDLVNTDGSGATAKTPQVSIRRASDGYYWNGSAFVSGQTWLNMTEVDATNEPGQYAYAFANPGTVASYRVYFRHTAAPVGFASELHSVVAEPASATAGARLVTLTVHDAAAAPVPYCVVDVYDSSNTVLLTRLSDDDGNGSVQLYLDDGTYKVRVSKARFAQDTLPATLTVSGPTSLTITGAVTPAPAASEPQMCLVSGYLLDPSGEPVANAAVEFHASTPQAIGNDLIAMRTLKATSDAAGYVEAALMRGAVVSISCSMAQISVSSVTIPQAASAQLADLVGF